jgi:hypothetical protein
MERIPPRNNLRWPARRSSARSAGGATPQWIEGA